MAGTLSEDCDKGLLVGGLWQPGVGGAYNTGALHDLAHVPATSSQLETVMESYASAVHRDPWNKGKIVGQKARFKG